MEIEEVVPWQTIANSTAEVMSLRLTASKGDSHSQQIYVYGTKQVRICSSAFPEEARLFNSSSPLEMKVFVTSSSDTTQLGDSHSTSQDVDTVEAIHM